MEKELWYFYADWCGFCAQQTPIIDEFEKEHPEINIVRINSERDADAVEHNKIESFPTLIPFIKGNAGGTRNGLQQKEILEKIFA